LDTVRYLGRYFSVNGIVWDEWNGLTGAQMAGQYKEITGSFQESASGKHARQGKGYRGQATVTFFNDCWMRSATVTARSRFQPHFSGSGTLSVSRTVRADILPVPLHCNHSTSL
jgi:hypothetical protein